MSSVTRHAAFLLGINVGGNRKVPMAQLKALLEKKGFKNVKTLLASGNVLFDAAPDRIGLEKKLETIIEKEFGFFVGVIVRTVDELLALRKKDPFKGITITKATRLYFTFLSSEAKKSALKLPYSTIDGNFRILCKTADEVVSVLTVTPERGTVDAMAVLTKEFGKKITTRNWNTIEKMLQA